MTNQNKIFSWIFYLAVIVVVLFFALQTVHDTDVWLHLGLGKYMVEHGELPRGDIFTYTGYGKPYEYFEWLFQVVLYLLYKASGYNGLMIFKLGLWLLTMGLLWQWMKVEGVESAEAAFLTLFPAYWLAIRWRERPEVTGYFFLAFYLWALSQYRHRGRPYMFFLPLTQILWINLHPSAILGTAVFMIILMGEGIDYFKDKRQESLRVIKALAVIIPLLWGASFINPYGYKSVIIPLLYSTSKAYKNLITEWKPLWNFAPLHYVYLAFLIPAALSFILRFWRSPERLKMAEVFLFIFGAALPYVSARYVAVFAVVSLPLAGKNFYWFFASGKIKPDWAARWPSKIPFSRWAWPGVILLLGGVLFWLSPQKDNFGWGLNRDVIPQQALAFIRQNHLPGHIFNQYAWGGYLILEGYPRYRAYIDSRALDLDIFQEYDQVLLAQPDWEKKLASRGVNLMMIRSLSSDRGRLVKLIPQLLQNPQWLLIWGEDTTLVFLRNSPENQEWAQKLALPKSRIFEEIIREGQYLLHHKVTQDTYGSMAWAYINRGDFPKAREAYRQHLELNPRDETAKNYLQMLEREGY